MTHFAGAALHKWIFYLTLHHYVTALFNIRFIGNNLASIYTKGKRKDALISSKKKKTQGNEKKKYLRDKHFFFVKSKEYKPSSIM